MTPLPILDLIAGLIFIYFLLSIINNSFFELISSFFKLRSSMLKDWLVTTFENSPGNSLSANEIMNHPILSGLTKQDKSPSYMGGNAFAKAVVDLILNKVISSSVTNAPSIDVNSLYAVIDTLGLPPKIASTLKTFLTKTSLEKKLNDKLNEIEHFEKQIADWFDGAMERVGSRFKRRTFVFTLIFATILTIALNVDSISLSRYLYSNPGAREIWAAQSYQAVSDPTVLKLIENIKLKKAGNSTDTSAKHNLDSLVLKIKTEKQVMDSVMAKLNANLPIGWTDTECGFFKEHKLQKSGGWLITILAICLGAPFWFEILTKIANIRSTIKPGKSGSSDPKKKTK